VGVFLEVRGAYRGILCATEPGPQVNRLRRRNSLDQVYVQALFGQPGAEPYMWGVLPRPTRV